MRILRGTFRLSLVVLAIVAFGALWKADEVAQKEAAEDRYMWQTLRCAERFLQRDMTQFTNQLGIIDIGTAGCAKQPFFANFDEVRWALVREDPYGNRYNQVFYQSMLEALFKALGWFVAVNLLGLGALIVWRTGKWVWSGYSDGRRSNAAR